MAARYAIEQSIALTTRKSKSLEENTKKQRRYYSFIAQHNVVYCTVALGCMYGIVLEVLQVLY